VTTSPPSSNPTFLNYEANSGISLDPITNAEGEAVDAQAYDVFGSLATDETGSVFGFDGQYSDGSSGLTNMRARWYEPGTGTFTSVDPDVATTDQAYEFAGDDPVNGGDPSGECAIGALTFGLVGCPPPNVSTQTSYWGAPQIAIGLGSNVELGEGISSQNISFTAKGVGNISIYIYNDDVQDTDTWFNVCLETPHNPANQCQSSDQTFDRTMVTYFPSKDSYTLDSGKNLEGAYDVQIEAIPDQIWSVFGNDFSDTPDYSVFAGTTLGFLNGHSFSNLAQSVSDVFGGCGPHAPAQFV
jgi:RHS repeat-associated protein